MVVAVEKNGAVWCLIRHNIRERERERPANKQINNLTLLERASKPLMTSLDQVKVSGRSRCLAKTYLFR